MQPRRNWLSLKPLMKQVSDKVVPDGQCAETALCPLSRVSAGSVVCIKQLATTGDLTSRLREMGFCEEQQIKLISRDSHLICLVCNARLGISAELAESILVAPLSPELKVA